MGRGDAWSHLPAPMLSSKSIERKLFEVLHDDVRIHALEVRTAFCVMFLVADMRNKGEILRAGCAKGHSSLATLGVRIVTREI